MEQGGKEFRESVTELSAKEYENYIFDTDSVYEVTIEYMPNQQLKNFCFGTNDCYKISLNTEEEQSNCFRFQDLSGVQGKKTFIMQTGKNGFPKLNIDSERFGEIEVLKVFVEKREKGYYENFEQGSLYTSQSIFHEVRNGTAEIEEGDLGKTLKLHTPNLKARYDAAVTNKGSLYLKGNTSYTVVFDFEARSQVNPGGFYYLDLIDGYEEGASRQEMENLPRKNIGEFYERTDNYVTRKTYTFYTGNFKQASLSFGGVNGVDFSVDNFLIVENTSGFVQEGKDIVAQRNEVPEILYDWGETEGFESGNFFTTPFTFGTLAFGRITQDKMLVIHGKASLWANAETEAANVGWFDFLKSDPDKLPIQGGKKYRLKFYYKVIENNPLSMFKVFFTTFDDEQKNREIILDLSRIGEIIEVDAVFELKESETPYYLMFSMIGGVANIVFDDICIQIES